MSTDFTQLKYWTGSGWFKPRRLVRSARACGVALGPSSVLTGSPGISLIVMKTTIETPRKAAK